MTDNLLFNQVAYKPFRILLKYINLVTNRILPNTSSTIRLYI